MKTFFLISLFLFILTDIFAHKNAVASGKINVTFHWDYSVEIIETDYSSDEEISISNSPFVLKSYENDEDVILKTIIEIKGDTKIISFITI